MHCSTVIIPVNFGLDWPLPIKFLNHILSCWYLSWKAIFLTNWFTFTLMSESNIKVQFVQQSKHKDHLWLTPILSEESFKGWGHSHAFEGRNHLHLWSGVASTPIYLLFGAIYWSRQLRVFWHLTSLLLNRFLFFFFFWWLHLVGSYHNKSIFCEAWSNHGSVACWCHSTSCGQDRVGVKIFVYHWKKCICIYVLGKKMYSTPTLGQVIGIH